MASNRWRFALLLVPIYLFLLLAPRAFAVDGAEAIPVIIMKLEGDGTAKVKRRQGIEEIAGVGGKLYQGDRVITDARSAVHLMVNDGSILKVGFQSELKIEGAEARDTFIGWTFNLISGVVRALVEKVPEKETRFRVNTPSGTVGVRGTEFVLVYNEPTHTSMLFTLEGQVSFGALDCEGKKSCADIGAGETSTFKAGDKKASQPQKFNVKDLFALAKALEQGEGENAALALLTPEVLARLSVFLDARKILQKPFTDLDEASLSKVKEDGEKDLAEAQDRAIGRRKEERAAMFEDAKKGTLRDTLDAADAYAAAKDVFKAETNGGAEDLLAQTRAAKHRLGEAVKKANKAGSFVSGKKENSSWKSADFKNRKNVEYANRESAKQQQASLEKALNEYQRMLAYVEALQEAQAAAAARAKAAACDPKACKLKRLKQQMEVAIEGVVKAYSGTATLEANNTGKQADTGKTGTVSTQFFSRAVAGNGCFQPKEECLMKPCAGFASGKKCKAGEITKVCTVKQIPVKCAEKPPTESQL